MLQLRSGEVPATLFIPMDPGMCGKSLASHPAPTPQPPSAPTGAATILAVDDCPVTLSVLRHILGGRYQLLTADNAIDALSLAARNQIDLFLVDLSMPDVDGSELCRTLRQLPRLGHVPVVVLTACTRPYDRVRCLVAGANAYLNKPVEPEAIISLLDRLLGRSPR